MSYSAVYTIQIYIPGLRCGSVSPINNKNWQAVALRDHADILLFLLISLICSFKRKQVSSLALKPQFGNYSKNVFTNRFFESFSLLSILVKFQSH